MRLCLLTQLFHAVVSLNTFDLFADGYAKSRCPIDEAVDCH